MAKVWFCRDGASPTVGSPAATVGLDECVQKLDLVRSNFLCDLSTTPRFGEPGDPMAVIRGNRHVVVEVEERDAVGRGWKPGFYRSPLLPQEASERLNL